MLVKSLKFRQKIVLIALALVVAVQAVTLFFVLSVLKRDSEGSMRRSIGLAAVVFDEYISDRSEQLQAAAQVLAADFGLREAVATAEPETILSTLQNHLARIDADLGLLLGTDGTVMASTFAGGSDSTVLDIDASFELTDEGATTVVTIAGRAFQVVSATLRAPLPIARVIVGFEVDEALVAHLGSITGLDVSFVRDAGESPQYFASTLSGESRIAAAQGIELSRYAEIPISTDSPTLYSNSSHLSLLRGFRFGNEPVFALLQLSRESAEQAYRDIQLILFAITLLSILAALIGSLFVSRMVTRPVDRLAAAVRRMGEGDYSERVDLRSSDEFGLLSRGFNAMQVAIADRQQQIVHAAMHDSLTGLPNREFVLKSVSDALEQGRPVAVANFSIVRLSTLIASLGHELSDRMIRQIADELRSCLDKKHVFGCLGSDTYLIAFVEADAGEIERALAKVERVLDEDVKIERTSYSMRMRAGVAESTASVNSAAALLYGASIARMEAEERHEAVVRYEHGQEERAIRKTRLLGEFFDATESDQLEVWFQPKVLCRSGEVAGAEALVRWQHPQFGLLAPGEFVETIEQAGCISRLTRWMLRNSMKQCRMWHDEGLDIGVAVNISADDLLDENLPYFLLDELASNGLRASSITLEITESAIMHNLAKSLSVIQCIHELGFRLSIDDFGTGHSSLAQLRRLPVDELKIDRSFLVDMEDSRDVSIVLATIEMAAGLGLQVCAEGIENLTLLPTLDGMGARYGQGFSISRPMPAEKFMQWCQTWQPDIALSPDTLRADALRADPSEDELVSELADTARMRAHNK